MGTEGCFCVHKPDDLYSLWLLCIKTVYKIRLIVKWMMVLVSEIITSFCSKDVWKNRFTLTQCACCSVYCVKRRLQLPMSHWAKYLLSDVKAKPEISHKQTSDRKIAVKCFTSLHNYKYSYSKNIAKHLVIYLSAVPITSADGLWCLSQLIYRAYLKNMTPWSNTFNSLLKYMNIYTGIQKFVFSK